MTQRIELDERTRGGAKRAVELNHRHLRPRTRTLVFTLPGHPGAHSVQRSRQRLDLPNAAAFLMAIPIEGKQALLANEGLNRVRLREERLDREAIAFADFLEKLICLRVQPAGVEREHAEDAANPGRHV